MVSLRLLASIALIYASQAMQFTQLGSSDLMVSKVCLGTMVGCSA